MNLATRLAGAGVLRSESLASVVAPACSYPSSTLGENSREEVEGPRGEGLAQGHTDSTRQSLHVQSGCSKCTMSDCIRPNPTAHRPNTPSGLRLSLGEHSIVITALRRDKALQIERENLFSHPDEDITDTERVNCSRKTQPLLFSLKKK